MTSNTDARIARRVGAARAVSFFAAACALILTANFAYAALAEARVIRVTAEDISKLPARENYVVDLRQTDVVYDLDGTSRAIDWNRVRIRKAAGDVASTAYFRERFPGSAEAMPTRLVIGATDGIMNVFGFEAAPNPGTEYDCKDNYCDCTGNKDCKKMLSAKVCKNNEGSCVVVKGVLLCGCDEK